MGAEQSRAEQSRAEQSRAEQSRAEQRNYSIDLAKFVAAFLVIAIHTLPFYDFSENLEFVFVDIICRFAVPFYAICSGYFLGKKFEFCGGFAIKNQKNNSAINSYIKKILKLYFVWSVFYLFFYIHDGINNQWLSSRSMLDWILSFFLNGSWYHMWYLLALLYSLILVEVLLPYIKIKNFPYIVFGLWFFEVIEYGYRIFLPQMQVIFQIYDHTGCVGIALFRIFPLLLSGIYISKIELKKSKWFKYASVNVFLLIAEAVLLKKLGQVRFSYIFFTLSANVFVFIKIVEEKMKIGKIGNILRMSTMIYCVHPAVIYVLKCVGIRSHGMLFCLVSLLSFAFAYGIKKLKYKVISIVQQNKA